MLFSSAPKAKPSHFPSATCSSVRVIFYCCYECLGSAKTLQLHHVAVSCIRARAPGLGNLSLRKRKYVAFTSVAARSKFHPHTHKDTRANRLFFSHPPASRMNPIFSLYLHARPLAKYTFFRPDLVLAVTLLQATYSRLAHTGTGWAMSRNPDYSCHRDYP